MTTTQKNISFVALIMLVLLLVSVGAQQKDHPAITYKLNAEASTEYRSIIQEQNRLIEKLQALEKQRIALMIGAGIPVNERDRVATSEGELVTFPPKPEKKN